jgi:hypothetical protein
MVNTFGVLLAFATPNYNASQARSKGEQPKRARFVVVLVSRTVRLTPLNQQDY